MAHSFVCSYIHSFIQQTPLASTVNQGGKEDRQGTSWLCLGSSQSGGGQTDRHNFNLREPSATGLGSTGEGAGGGRRTSQGAAGESQGAWGCPWGGVASIIWNSAWTCPQAWPERINSDCPRPTPQHQTKQEKTQHSYTHRCGN